MGKFPLASASLQMPPVLVMEHSTIHKIIALLCISCPYGRLYDGPLSDLLSSLAAQFNSQPIRHYLCNKEQSGIIIALRILG